LLLAGPQLFGIRSGEWCGKYKVDDSKSTMWNAATGKKIASSVNVTDIVMCRNFHECPEEDQICLEDKKFRADANGKQFVYDDLEDFSSDCLTCKIIDHTHGTLMFNMFVWAQIFNEYNSKSLTDEWDVFSDLPTNHMFLAVSAITIGLQIFLINLGGEFLGVTALTLNQWLVTVALGFIAIPIGIIMRFFPVTEDPASFFTDTTADTGGGKPSSVQIEMPTKKEVA